MFNGKLQPRLTARAVLVLLVLLGALVGAAGTAQAGETLAKTPHSPNQVKAQTLAPSPIPSPTPPQVSGKSSSEARAEAVGAESPQRATPSVLFTAAGRRDPFKPLVTPGLASHLAAGRVSGGLPAGIRGLVISQLRLEGIVCQEPADTMVAIVTNYTKRAYFLRVNDKVYNGHVSKITPEAVYFMENTLDSSGRVTTHEVVMKLGSAPGEAR